MPKLRALALCAAFATMLAYTRVSAWLDAVPKAGAALAAAREPTGPSAPSASDGSRPEPVALSPGAPSLVATATPVEAAPGEIPEIKPIAARTPPLANTRNFLIVGLDRRPDGGGAWLTDTLIVAVLDERSGHVGLVSIPRDLYVDIPEHAPDRINTVYALARRTKQEPLPLLERVVADTLKLPIEHALAIDLRVFERAIDSLAGVTVEVPCAIRDRFIDPRVEGGKRWLDVDAGAVHMDGVTAARYVRSRHGRSDFSRARRQQAVLLGVKHELAGANGLLQIPALYSEFEQSIETDFKRSELLALSRRALRLDPAHLHGLVLTPPLTRAYRTADGRAVLTADFAAVDAALRDLFSAPAPGARAPRSTCEPKDVALAASQPG
jgi:LCP family protein required for cell wall assembly